MTYIVYVVRVYPIPIQRSGTKWDVSPEWHVFSCTPTLYINYSLHFACPRHFWVSSLKFRRYFHISFETYVKTCRKRREYFPEQWNHLNFKKTYVMLSFITKALSFLREMFSYRFCNKINVNSSSRKINERLQFFLVFPPVCLKVTEKGQFTCISSTVKL